ncbi:15494_t:CDS:2, partial [Gigaspora margarita]
MEPALSDVEEFQVELVDPECEQASELSLSENEPFEDELVNEDDELVNMADEFPEIACFTSHLHIKNIVHSSVPVEYPLTLPEVHKEERDCMGIKICHFTDPSLVNIEHNEVDVDCSKYNIGDQWHRYIKIDYESIDIVLLRDLFLGKAE